MKSPQRVVWSEGMLISPHHLQQSDLYHERLLHSRLGALSPTPWGVTALELDVAALAAGQVRVSRFTGVLPDGLFLSFEAGDPECPPARPLEGHFPPALPAVEVFLGVPLERETGASVARAGVAPSGARTRFTTVDRAIADNLGEAADLEVSFAQRNVSLLFGDEPREDFRTVKVAEIVRDGAGALALNDVFVPPVLRLGASSFLVAQTRRLLSQLVARQRQLSEERRQRDASTVEFAAHDVTRFLLLHTLNTTIPLLAHFDRAGDVHPRELYLVLASLAGQLSTFAVADDLSRIPAYAFTDGRATFEELFALCNTLLTETVRDVVFTLPLTVNQGVFIGRLEDDRMLRCQQFVLAVRGQDLTEEHLTAKLPGLCKIASWNQLTTVLRSATPGVPVQATLRPPAEVPVKAGTAYFLVDAKSDHFRAILQERTIGVYLPPPTFDPAKLKIDFMGIPPKAK
jgi:type VI secretion system protein ImpJ